MMGSAHHDLVSDDVEMSLGLEECRAVPDRTNYSKPCAADTTALLFPHCPAILISLHLAYEVA